MLSSTRDVNPGDVLHVGERRLVAIESTPDGISCVYYHAGLGPHYVVLPHATLNKRMYENEAIGARESWWNTHPDMTGKYREF